MLLMARWCLCPGKNGSVSIMVFHPSGMNSWFWYEFMVCSMGPISANIADNLVKIDYGMLPMMLGSGITMASV